MLRKSRAFGVGALARSLSDSHIRTLLYPLIYLPTFHAYRDVKLSNREKGMSYAKLLRAEAAGIPMK